MLKTTAAIVFCLSTICLSSLPTFSQSNSTYQVATIMAVAPHKAAAASDDSAASYEVSVKVGDTVYVVLYTPPLGMETVRYVAGRDILVLVGEKTVKFNDQLGNSQEIPILSQAPTATTTQTSPTAGPPQTQAIAQTPIKAVELVGLAGIKDNTEGALTIESGKLHFVHAKKTADIAAIAMVDVMTGAESQRVIRGTMGTLSMFGPYGSGRFLSLFRSNLDSLTIQYRDADGGLHGVVFGVPVGQAESIKKELVAEGAHTNLPPQADPSAASSKSVATEGKQ
jgi:uncharacterized protein YpmB